MTAFVFHLTGCSERLLVEVDAPSLADLARELSCSRYLVGQMVAVDGEATSREMIVPTQRISLIVEPE